MKAETTEAILEAARRMGFDFEARWNYLPSGGGAATHAVVFGKQGQLLAAAALAGKSIPEKHLQHLYRDLQFALYDDMGTDRIVY